MSVRPGQRLRGLPLSRYPWYVRLILMLQRRKYGYALEPALLWGRLPRAFVMLTLPYRSLDRSISTLEPELRSLVQVRISQINWCAFCTDLNSALAYAEAVTDSSRRVDDALFSRLRQHFTEQEIVELTALIAYQNMSSKFNAALGVPAQGFCATSPQ